MDSTSKQNNRLFRQKKWISSQASNTTTGGLCIYLLSDQNYTWSNTDCSNIKGVICETHKFPFENKTSNDENYIKYNGCRGENVMTFKSKGNIFQSSKF